MHDILVVPFESVGDGCVGRDVWAEEYGGTKDGGGVEIVEHDWSELNDFDEEILLLSMSEWDSKNIFYFNFNELF